ncbi:MAG TPA: sigma-70 family RNA polymerase sigma factor [Candidatus Sulfomarinibacteraceae bacterium]|nr:sigma-70 family RNA polymerase sigma factor [Candidatus Sulfomarinibacteraceae bacterium]
MTISDQGALSWNQQESQLSQDERLIARCLKGEEAAFSALYDRYAAYVYRLSYGLLQHREDAEEVLQDTFDYAFRKLARYDAGRASFKTWLYQIAVSRARNKRRRKCAPTFSLSQLAGYGAQAADDRTPGPDETLALDDRQRIIWRALSELSPKLRETAVLRYYEGLTYPEIGQILNIPAKTAESRMRLAHKALKEMLDGLQL